MRATLSFIEGQKPSELQDVITPSNGAAYGLPPELVWIQVLSVHGSPPELLAWYVSPSVTEALADDGSTSAVTVAIVASATRAVRWIHPPCMR
jgi:hypothetical protein